MLTMYGIARIGRDAELRHTPQGEAVINLSLAFSYGRKGADGKTPTTWVDGALWGKRAESLAEYLVRGQAVLVTVGDVHIEIFKTRDGGQGSKIVGRVSEIEFAGPRPEAPKAPPPQQRQAPPQRQQAPASSGFDDMDDDIPF